MFVVTRVSIFRRVVLVTVFLVLMITMPPTMLNNNLMTTNTMTHTQTQQLQHLEIVL